MNHKEIDLVIIEHGRLKWNRKAFIGRVEACHRWTKGNTKQSLKLIFKFDVAKEKLRRKRKTKTDTGIGKPKMTQ